jgi:acyl-CoA thioester hydrolase
MAEMAAPHVFPFMIAYADTDAGGIVYHARYVEIAERARMAAFAGIDDPGGGFVIRELHVKYLRPLRLADKFDVETRFMNPSAAAMEIEQKFIKDGETCCVLTGTAVYVNKELKPARLPKAWLAMTEK